MRHLDYMTSMVVVMVASMVVVMVVVIVFNLEKAESQDKARVCRSIFEAGARSEYNSE